MKYRKLTASGDYSFGNNKNDFYTGQDAIMQAIKTKIKLYYGEWWEDLGVGIPFLRSIIGQTNKSNVALVVSSLLKQRLKDVKEVVSVSNIETLIDGRRITIKMNVGTTESGQSEIEVSI